MVPCLLLSYVYVTKLQLRAKIHIRISVEKQDSHVPFEFLIVQNSELNVVIF